MTIHSLVGTFRQLFLWLCYRHQWTVWELLALSGGILLLLLLLRTAKKQRDERRVRMAAHLLQQNPPIIGIKLARGKRGMEDVANSKAHLLASFSGKKRGTKSAIELPTAAATAQTPRREVMEHQQTDAHLFSRQLDELKTINEQLQNQISQSKRNEEHLRRRMARLLNTGKKLRQELGKLERTKEVPLRQPDTVTSQRFGGTLTGLVHDKTHSKWSPLELLAAHRLSRGGPNPRGHDDAMPTANQERGINSRRANEPLDVEKLKAIAALARQIQGQSRRS